MLLFIFRYRKQTRKADIPKVHCINVFHQMPASLLHFNICEWVSSFTPACIKSLFFQSIQIQYPFDLEHCHRLDKDGFFFLSQWTTLSCSQRPVIKCAALYGDGVIEAGCHKSCPQPLSLIFYIFFFLSRWMWKGINKRRSCRKTQGFSLQLPRRALQRRRHTRTLALAQGSRELCPAIWDFGETTPRLQKS